MLSMNVFKKNNRIPAVLIIAIIFIAGFFHYSIHIENALTLETLSEFGIHIPVWKIVFEPVLGILLFYNRSFHALTELRFLLFWILAIFMIYTLVKSVLIKEKLLRRRFIIGQLVAVPIVIGLWFALLVIIIFIPLPNNTIVNNSADKILVTTHSHTAYSHDGLISQEALWKWHKRNGFDAFFITDHNNHDHTLDFVQDQRDHKFPGEPLVMCGEEFSGSNHMSLLGLKGKFSTRGLSDSAVVSLTRAGNGAVIVNHWFDGEHKSLEYYKNLGVDGFEIENVATDKTYDRKVYQKIKDFCQGNNLLMNGGLDFHGYGNVCSLWNAFQIPGWHSLDRVSKEEAILKIIRSRDQNNLLVLLYNDRPYYTTKYLYLSPLFTFFNYFRTLNFYQVISWIFWIFLVALIKRRISDLQKSKRHFTVCRLVPVFGMIGALFLIGLGLVYFTRIEEIDGFTKMYREYSVLLSYTGSAFLVYSAVVFFFNYFKRSA